MSRPYEEQMAHAARKQAGCRWMVLTLPSERLGSSVVVDDDRYGQPGATELRSSLAAELHRELAASLGCSP